MHCALPDVSSAVAAGGDDQLLAGVKPNGVDRSRVTGVLQQWPAGMHAPDDGRVVSRSGANDGLAYPGDGHLPDSVLVTGVASQRDAVDCGRGALQVRHNLVGLLPQLVGVRPVKMLKAV